MRISPLPCSKELLPIGYQKDQQGAIKPKVVSHYLLERFKLAGINKAYFVLRKGKWDIPQYYGDGEMLDMHLAYVMMNRPYGHPFSIDQAFPFTHASLVAFGYPDILFSPDDAFAQLIAKYEETRADVVLGVFPIRPDQKWDIMSFAEDGKPKAIAMSDPSGVTDRWGWSIALWTPVFSAFMHEFLSRAVDRHQLKAPDGKEYVMNHVFQAALDAGLSLEQVFFKAGFVRDVGTPQELLKAQQILLTEAGILADQDRKG